MPHGPLLLEEGKVKINWMLGKGNIPASIAHILNRSKQFIANYMRDSVGYGKKKPTGRPCILSQFDKSAINRGKWCKKPVSRRLLLLPAWKRFPWQCTGILVAMEYTHTEQNFKRWTTSPIMFKPVSFGLSTMLIGKMCVICLSFLMMIVSISMAWWL